MMNMKSYKIISMLLITAFAVLNVCGTVAYTTGEEYVVYASPNGLYENSGTLNNPTSILGARDKIRAVKSEGTYTGFKVVLLGGEYNIEETIVLNASDGGTPQNPVTYKAADGETAYIKGSKHIDAQRITPICDEDVLNRVPEKLADKIVQIDLRGIDGITPEKMDLSLGRNKASGSTLKLFYDGKKQPLSRYPNFGYNTISSYDTETNTAVLSDMKPQWQDVSKAYIDGYLGTDWNRSWDEIVSINTAEKSMRLAGKTAYVPRAGGRWAIVNMPEEIDMPGEWCIDTEKMQMYFYPPYKTSDYADKIEVGFVNNALFRIESASNILIENISFSNVMRNPYKKSLYNDEPSGSGNAIEILNCSNIEVNGCDIRNTGDSGIYISGTDIKVLNSTISNTGGRGIIVRYGGDRDTLQKSNNIFLNNHFYNIATDDGANGATAISLWEKTFGATVENNLIHNIPLQGIRFAGNENVIKNNEIYNIGRYGQDVGAIYTGRNFAEYGNVVERNYIHDIGSEILSNVSPRVGVFLDDFHSGTTVRDNIIEFNNPDLKTFGVLSGSGKDNVITGNTVINATNGVRLSTYLLLNECLDIKSVLKAETGFKTAYDKITDSLSEQFVQKYPKMMELKKDIDENNIYIPDGHTVTGNTFVNCSAGVTSNSDAVVNYRSGNTVNDNQSVETADISLDGIGLSNPEALKLKESFRVYQTDERFIDETVKLYWEPALGADEYRCELSHTRDFSSISNSVAVRDNMAEFSGIKEGIYYYRVCAISKSGSEDTEWLSLNTGKFQYISGLKFNAYYIKGMDTVVLNGHTSQSGAGNPLNVTLTDENGELAYIGEIESAADGSFSHKFKFSGNIGKLKIKENYIDAENVSVSMLSADSISNVFIETENKQDFFTAEDRDINVGFSVSEDIRDYSKCVIYAACYDSSGSLVDVKRLPAVFGNEMYSIGTVDENTETLKIYVWDYSTKIRPVTAAKAFNRQK